MAIRMSTTVISVRVKKKIKDLLEKEGIDIADEIRRYLEELAEKIIIRKYIEKWDNLLRNVKPSEKGFAEKSVREDRESH